MRQWYRKVGLGVLGIIIVASSCAHLKVSGEGGRQSRMVVKEQWNLALSPTQLYPVVVKYGSKLLIVEEGKALYYIDRYSGILQWKRNLAKHNRAFRPVAKGHSIFIGSNNGILCLAERDGHVIRTAGGTDSATGPLALQDGNLLWTDAEGRINSSRCEDFKLNWRSAVLPGRDVKTMVVIRNRVVITSSDNLLVVLDAVTGKMLWGKETGQIDAMLDLGGKELLCHEVDARQMLENNQVVGDVRYLICDYDLNSGTVRWLMKAGVGSTIPAFRNGLLFYEREEASSSRPSVVALEWKSKHVRWRSAITDEEIQYGVYGAKLSGSADGILRMPSVGGLLVLRSTTNGSILGSATIPQCNYISPLEKWVYCASFGELTAYRLGQPIFTPERKGGAGV